MCALVVLLGCPSTHIHALVIANVYLLVIPVESLQSLRDVLSSTMKELEEFRIAYPYEATELRTVHKPIVQCLRLFVGGGGRLQYYT